MQQIFYWINIILINYFITNIFTINYFHKINISQNNFTKYFTQIKKYKNICTKNDNFFHQILHIIKNSKNTKKGSKFTKKGQFSSKTTKIPLFWPFFEKWPYVNGLVLHFGHFSKKTPILTIFDPFLSFFHFFSHFFSCKILIMINYS